MKHKILGYLFVFLVLAATVSVLYYVEVKNSSMDTRNRLPFHHIVVLQQVSDVGKNFVMFFSKDYESLGNPEKGFPNYFSGKAETVTRIRIPSGVYPKTNFIEGLVNVAEQSNSNIVNCKKYSNGSVNLKTTDETEIINGNSFDKAEFSDAGAGNFYDTRLYRILHGTVCYEISLTLHTANIGNFTPGSVSEVNMSTAWNSLAQILNTFKFTDKTQAINSQTGTLKGHVDIGPLCPVERPGMPCGKVDYSKTKILVYKAGSTVVLKTIAIDNTGNYSILLAPGNYSTDIQSNYGFHAQNQTQKATILTGQAVTLNFSIDTGIR